MKKLLIVAVMFFCLGLTPKEITEKYNQDFKVIRTKFKTGQITDTQANIDFDALTEKYNNDMYADGVTTEAEGKKLAKIRKQDIRDRIGNVSDENLRIILYDLLDGSTYPISVNISAGLGNGGFGLIEFAGVIVAFFLTLFGLPTLFRKGKK